MNEEDSMIQIPLQVVPDEPELQHNKPRRFMVLTRLGLLLCVAILARVIPFSRIVNDDGSVQVRESWASFSHYAFGQDPDMRMERYNDGRIMSGPIVFGKRHGNWTIHQNGEVTQKSYSFGTEQ